MILPPPHSASVFPLRPQALMRTHADQVVADAVRCTNGWKARTTVWPQRGAPEVYECASVDATEGLALQRAHALW